MPELRIYSGLFALNELDVLFTVDRPHAFELALKKVHYFQKTHYFLIFPFQTSKTPKVNQKQHLCYTKNVFHASLEKNMAPITRREFFKAVGGYKQFVEVVEFWTDNFEHMSQHLFLLLFDDVIFLK